MTFRDLKSEFLLERTCGILKKGSPEFGVRGSLGDYLLLEALVSFVSHFCLLSNGVENKGIYAGIFDSLSITKALLLEFQLSIIQTHNETARSASVLVYECLGVLCNPQE
jgi:hypothetical protein